MYAGLRVELVTQPPREAITDAFGYFRLADVKPGAYMVRLHLPPGEAWEEHDRRGDSDEYQELEPLLLTTRVVAQAGGPSLRTFDLASIRHPDAESGY